MSGDSGDHVGLMASICLILLAARSVMFMSPPNIRIAGIWCSHQFGFEYFSFTILDLTFLPAALPAAGLDLTLSVVSQSVNKTQKSHLETSNADSAQSKDVWNENLEFLMGSAVCLLSADCLLSPKRAI